MIFTDDDDLPSAIYLLARHLIHAAVTEGGRPPAREEYPAISEDDWAAVMVQVAHLTVDPPTVLYDAAHNLLTARANTLPPLERET